MADSLLPNGFEDSIDPQAGREGAAVEELVSGFEGLGYRRVRPPLLEFEQTLTTGPGADSADLLFRVPDPITNRMLAIRADITVQVARLAQTRLAHAKRPLRLCYSGQVLRTVGEELRPNRQLTQVGLEVIGLDASAAELLATDLEVLRAVWLGLAALGLTGIEAGQEPVQLDLTLPDLLPGLASALGVASDALPRFAVALDSRDAAALAELAQATDAALLLQELLTLPSAADETLDALAALFPGKTVARALAPAVALTEQLQSPLGAGFRLSVDPTERRGTPYHHGLGYNLYLAGQLIGRGGRYRLDDGRLATGCTLYLDTLGGLLPRRSADRPLLAVPLDCPAHELAGLQAQGWRTLLTGSSPVRARAAGATHLYRNQQLEELSA